MAAPCLVPLHPNKQNTAYSFSCSTTFRVILDLENPKKWPEQCLNLCPSLSDIHACLKRFHPGNRAGVFTSEIFHPSYQDLGLKNQ